MARVPVDVEEIELEGDTGRDVPELRLTCKRCEHTVEVYGTSDVSARRGAVMLHEECPDEENNFYIVE